jgi:hypothetical protein
MKELPNSIIKVIGKSLRAGFCLPGAPNRRILQFVPPILFSLNGVEDAEVRPLYSRVRFTLNAFYPNGVRMSMKPGERHMHTLARTISMIVGVERSGIR